MKLKQLIHPEMLLGKRGAEENIKSYKLIMKMFKKVNGSVEAVLKMISDSPHGLSHFGLPHEIGLSLLVWEELYNWYSSNRKIFYFPKEFIVKLDEVHLNIPHNFLPKNFIAYFAYPQNYLETPDEELADFSGCYVSLTPELKDGSWTPNTSVRITFIDEVTLEQSILRFVIYDGETIEHSIDELLESRKDLEEMASKHKNGFKTLKEFYRLGKEKSFKTARERVNIIINSLCYVHSQHPDIIYLRPQHHLQEKHEQRKTEPKDDINYCTLGVEKVSWNYKKGHERYWHVDGCTVTGHSRIIHKDTPKEKQIWIKPYNKDFTKSAQY